MGSEAWTSIRYSRRGVDIMLCNMEFGKWCGTGYLYGPEFILSPTSDPRLISFVRLSFWSRASIDSFPFFLSLLPFFFFYFVIENNRCLRLFVLFSSDIEGKKSYFRTIHNIFQIRIIYSRTTGFSTVRRVIEFFKIGLKVSSIRSTICCSIVNNFYLR